MTIGAIFATVFSLLMLGLWSLRLMAQKRQMLALASEDAAFSFSVDARRILDDDALVARLDGLVSSLGLISTGRSDAPDVVTGRGEVRRAAVCTLFLVDANGVTHDLAEDQDRAAIESLGHAVAARLGVPLDDASLVREGALRSFDEHQRQIPYIDAL